MENKCYTCGQKATKKINTGNDVGFFFLCDNEKCKESLKNELTRNNHADA